MKKFWALLKVSFQAMLLSSGGGAASGRRKRRVRTALGAVAIIAAVGLYISGVYSWMLLEVLAPIHMESLLFIFMGIAAVASGLLFTTFGVKTAIYGGNDNDLLMSMPVSSTVLMLSKVAAIYVENLLFSAFMLMPAGVAYAIVSPTGAARTVGFWLRMLVAVVSLPMLDTCVSLLLGALIAWLSSKITKNNIGQTLVMGLYLAVLFYFSFNISNMIEGLAVNAAKVRAAMQWLRPVIWMADGVMGSWKDILKFLLVCLVPFALAVLALGATYRRAVTAFNAQSARSDYRLSGQRSVGQVRALLKKEFSRFLGNAMYFWNAALGGVMLVAAGVFLLIRGKTLVPYLDMLGDSAWVLLIALCTAGFCLSTLLIAAPSVSLEGASLWILREAPVPVRTLLRVKTGFELIISVPCVLIAAVCVALSGLLTAGQWALLTAFMLAFAVGHACFGMLIGLRFPKLDAPNENVVIKRSLLGFLSIFAPMVALAAGVFIGWLLSKAVASWTLAQSMVNGVLIVTALFAAISALLLGKNGEKLLLGLGEQG